MSRRLHLALLLVRPAVIALLAMFTATGLAQAGRGEDTALLARALLVMSGFLVFSVACNDLADEAIDRVNLPGRPLVTGAITRREFTLIGLAAGALALAASTTLHWPAMVVTAAGLAVSAGYSMRPVRLADRGAVASLVLPACYVAVPYLTGVFAVRVTVHGGDLLLLTGLYLGFIGRILLKDFRDVRGDALFGKRTFLVRHGRRWTCAVSACCWAGGTGIILAAAHRPTVALGTAEAGGALGALVLLRALAGSRSARRDETVISATAIIGRGMIVILLAHLAMTGAAWPAPRYDAVMGMLFLLTAGMARSVLQHGPVSRLTVPAIIGPATARPGVRHQVPAGAGVAACPPHGQQAAGSPVAPDGRPR